MADDEEAATESGMATPLPVKLIVPDVLIVFEKEPPYAMVTPPRRVPVAVGVKVMASLQEVWIGRRAASLPQVLVSEKSPLAVTVKIVRFVLPAALNVTGMGALEVPTN